MTEQRSCAVFLPAGRDAAEHEKAVRDAAIFLAMQHHLEAIEIVPLTVEGTTRRGWFVVLKGGARWLARLPAGDEALAAVVAERANAEWSYQFRDEGDSRLVRMLAGYSEVDRVQ